MVRISSKIMLIGLFGLVLLFMGSFVAEASYYTERYGPTSYNQGNSYTGFNRGNERGSFLNFPVYPGNFQQANNRNSFDFGQVFDQEDTRSVNNQFNERINNRNFGQNINFGQQLLDENTFGNSNQNGFNTGSVSYSVGDGNQLSYRRTFLIDGPRSKDQYFAEENVYGLERVNVNRNFGNSFTNNAGFNRRGLTNNVQTSNNIVDNNLNRNTVRNTQENNRFSNQYTLSESDFGNGFFINFNRY